MNGEKSEIIVLVNPPNKQIVLRDMYSSTISKGLYNWPCVDLLVLSGVLSPFYDVKLIDANTLRLSVGETVARIAALKPKGVVFSFGNSVRDDDYKFVGELRRELPGVKMCGTGGLLYHNSEPELENHPEIDACLLNFTSEDIVKYLNDDFNYINNLVYKRDGNIIRAPLKYCDNGFSYPVPLHEQLPLNKYNISHGKAKPLTSILASYGCPAKCSFCVAGRIDYRYRSPENVIAELDAVKRLGVKEIFFRDNVFCANKKQGFAIMDMMTKNDYGFSWIADTRANVISDETAELMKRSGCHALHIGVESANPIILKTYGKGIDLEQIKQAFRACRQHGIKTVGYFILGLPGETINDVKATIDLAIELNCDYASFNVAIPIIGTPLREEAIEKGWIDPNSSNKYDGSHEPLIETEMLSKKDLMGIQNTANRKFYLRFSYIVNKIISPRNIYQARMLAHEFSGFLKGSINV